MQKNGSRTGLTGQIFKYLDVAEDSLVAEYYINECLQARLKLGGGSLQVWGCISANGFCYVFGQD